MTNESKDKVVLGSAIIAGVLAVGGIIYFGVKFFKNKKSKSQEFKKETPAAADESVNRNDMCYELSKALGKRINAPRTAREKFMVSVLKRIQQYEPHPDIEKFEAMSKEEIIKFLKDEYDVQSYKFTDIETCRRFALCIGAVSSGLQFTSMEVMNNNFGVLQKAMSCHDNMVRTTLMMWLLKGMQFSTNGDLVSAHQMIDLVATIIKKIKIELTDKLLAMNVKHIPSQQAVMSALVEIDCACHVAGVAYRPGDPTCVGSMFAEKEYRKKYADSINMKMKSGVMANWGSTAHYQ